MNVITKYNIEDSVLFFYSIKNPQNVYLFVGIITDIKINCSKHYTEIKYDIDVLPRQYPDQLNYREYPDKITIEEQYLFKDDRDLFKIFKENVRNYLNPENIKEFKIKKEQNDDLPF